ncbi:hypothetical protein TWF718_009701 [Orbilia javanica]|uniref:Uncharacterized protein n=1 Tax=Orbilia javanica TaxID=47235 RepID=A0AAN8RLM0_9PEZI
MSQQRTPYGARPRVTPTLLNTDSLSDRDRVGVMIWKWCTRGTYGARRQLRDLEDSLRGLGIGFRLESLLWHGVLITVEGLGPGDPRKDTAERLLEPYLNDRRIIWFQDDDELGPDVLRECWNLYLEEGAATGVFSLS